MSSIPALMTASLEARAAQAAAYHSGRAKELAAGDEPACITCAYWRHDNGSTRGICHGVPPQVAPGEGPFPVTGYDDFCPVYEDRNAAKGGA